MSQNHTSLAASNFLTRKLNLIQAILIHILVAGRVQTPSTAFLESFMIEDLFKAPNSRANSPRSSQPKRRADIDDDGGDSTGDSQEYKRSKPFGELGLNRAVSIHFANYRRETTAQAAIGKTILPKQCISTCDVRRCISSATATCKQCPLAF